MAATGLGQYRKVYESRVIRTVDYTTTSLTLVSFFLATITTLLPSDYLDGTFIVVTGVTTIILLVWLLFLLYLALSETAKRRKRMVTDHDEPSAQSNAELPDAQMQHVSGSLNDDLSRSGSSATSSTSEDDPLLSVDNSIQAEEDDNRDDDVQASAPIHHAKHRESHKHKRNNCCGCCSAVECCACMRISTIVIGAIIVVLGWLIACAFINLAVFWWSNAVVLFAGLVIRAVIERRRAITEAQSAAAPTVT
jgi:hypothetical protein